MKSLPAFLFEQKRLSSLVGLCLMLFIASCAKNPVTGKRQFNLMGEGQEIALGKQSDPGITAGYGVYNDAKLQNFITQKGKQMAAISHRSHLNYEFKILDSPVVNAFAVPGGYIYFTRGIMAHFNNEAEFAGVLGHEIGHVTARHSAQQYSNQMLGQVLLIGGLIASPEFAQFADVASQSMSLLFLKFGRDMESQSDELGVEYSTKIGYDAHQMGDFFNTLHRLSTDDGKNESLPTFLSTHPDPLDRHAKVHEMADKAQTGGKKYKIGRDSYLRMIDGIIYGNDPRQGFVENNMFYHPEMKFSYKVPSGWKVNNTPAQVQMLQKDGEAAMFLTLGQGNNLQEAINAEAQKNKLTVIEKQATNVNGNSAMIVRSQQVRQNQQGQQTKLELISYYIQYNGAIYIFHGMTYDKFLSKYRSTFENSMKSFRKLTDASKLNKQPERVKIVTVPNNMSLQKALNHFKMASDRHKEISILNGMKLSDQVKKGMLIKVLGE